MGAASTGQVPQMKAQPMNEGSNVNGETKTTVARRPQSGA
jgi:hypothetical protein